MTNLPEGVASHMAKTPRMTMRYLESGDPAGTPVVFLHGNLATSRFYDHILAAIPPGFRCIAPDMRGFGDSEKLTIDGTRGLSDWSDDTRSLLEHLGVTQPAHFVGWSTGGGAIMQYLIDHASDVLSLTLIDTVSPYGFGGGTRADGSPTSDDYAGGGGGSGNPEFAQRIADGDTGSDSEVSPRNVMNGFYWRADHREPPEREDMLVAEVLKSLIGDGGYPGDSVPSPNWPGFAPGSTGILNALSSRYLDTSGIVDVDPKPPILWTHGSADLVVANGTPWEMGTLGSLGVVPGWPGEDAYPPQQMVTQIRSVLDEYASRGGTYREEVFEGSGHGPHIDAADEWMKVFFGFLG
ncbi:MAG: alpha/beta fold hydrolase [Acidimicrobiia bacterium]|nr:alpha/beta fold hydrolase [Acidimicrobiia bacterium]NNF65743.1 alpha/beta fold hydrolase [Acidimicrobiia bacterium]